MFKTKKKTTKNYEKRQIRKLLLSQNLKKINLINTMV